MAVKNFAASDTAGEEFYRVRNAPQVIRLGRRVDYGPLSPTGSYCCIIPTSGGNITFCINLGKYCSYFIISLTGKEVNSYSILGVFCK